MILSSSNPVLIVKHPMLWYLFFSEKLIHCELNWPPRWRATKTNSKFVFKKLLF